MKGVTVDNHVIYVLIYMYIVCIRRGTERDVCKKRRVEKKEQRGMRERDWKRDGQKNATTTL